MGQVLHGSAKTTEAVRRAIQRSEESVRLLAGRYGISPTTVQKWRNLQIRLCPAAREGRSADRPTAVAFLEALLEAVPYDLHTILTNNGIEHRLTKPNHPWTNGQSLPRRRPGSSG